MKVTKYTMRLDEDRLPALRKDMSFTYRGRVTEKAEDVASLLQCIEQTGELDQETMFLLCYDNKLRFLGYFMLAAGGSTECGIDMQLLFTRALSVGAQNIILSHNHPSGALVPSELDMALTRDTCLARKYTGITLVDHIITAKDGYVSMKNACPWVFPE